jgi:hypothetical protein
VSTDGRDSHEGFPSRRRAFAAFASGSGRAQLTLVEHALCPLDTAASLARGLTHRGEFHYLDQDRRRQTAMAEVVCPFGLSPGDEFYLWGLLALSLSQPDPTPEFYATPYYCLRELGAIDAATGQGTSGGKNYALFRQAIRRLAAVTYINDHFYDPVRGEHRAVAFGFFSYSHPVDEGSSRAWRFAWDPIFFEFCQAARGSLVFDLETYRALDFAGRRLFLLLKKIFHRHAQSPAFDAAHLGVNVLGFAPGIDVWNLKAKLTQCWRRLAEHEIVLPPTAASGTKGLFEKKGVGRYSVRFQRGAYFDKPPAAPRSLRLEQSALSEPLRAIGFDDAAVARIVARYKHQLVQVWADITLAARERSPDFFKVSPQAYFMDNIENAARGERTPPDWWYDHRKEAQRREREHQRDTEQGPASSNDDHDRAFENYLQGEAREAFAQLVERLQLRNEEAGQPRRQAARNADESARHHMKHRFRKDHPAGDSSSPQSLAEILERFRLR